MDDLKDKIDAGCLPKDATSERLIIKESFIKKALVEDQFGQLIPLEKYILSLMRKVVEEEKDYIYSEDMVRVVEIGGEWFKKVFEEEIHKTLDERYDNRYKKLKGVK